MRPVLTRHAVWLALTAVLAFCLLPGAGAAGAATAVPGPLAAVPGVASASLSPEQRARTIAAQAYIYGLAPLDEQRVIAHFPTNHLISVTELSTPAERLVPLPNVDTLYTTARLDLSGGPLVVHVPEEHGRYYTLQLLDAYTNTFGYIGRRVTGTHPGTYAIIGPGWHGVLSPGVKAIHSPTPIVWLLGRTLLDGVADLPSVHAIQRGYTLSTLGGATLTSIFLPRSTLMPGSLPSSLGFLDALGTLLAQSPPPASERALLARFASVGIGPARSPSTEPLSATVRRGLLEGLADGRRQLDRYSSSLALSTERRTGGWLVPPTGIGAYGHDYLLRAYVAENALGANVPREAVYPLTAVDHTFAPLSGRRRYLLRFAPGQLPPVNAFWSLTMYTQNLFLYANPLQRYAIGDRTRGLHFGRDGSLTILLAHSVPGRLRSNWLPAPAGRFTVVLRLYQPRVSVLRGRWPLPIISRAG